jgi:hypothetical protein
MIIRYYVCRDLNILVSVNKKIRLFKKGRVKKGFKTAPLATEEMVDISL